MGNGTRRLRTAIVLMLSSLAAAGETVATTTMPSRSDRLLPWQEWVQRPIEASAKGVDGVMGLPWRNTGGKEGTLSVSDDEGPWGGKYFQFHVKVDHTNGQSWPAFETQPKPPLDFGGYDLIRYWIRCRTAVEREQALRFILWTDGVGRLQEPIRGVRRGQWVRASHRVADIPRLDRVDRVHFFLCEADYAHGDEMTFDIGGMELCKTRRESTRLSRGQAGMALWVGDGADATERIEIIDSQTQNLPALMVVETGPDVALKLDDDLCIRYHEVFSGAETERSRPLACNVPEGCLTRVQTRFEAGGLAPGYYLVVADVLRGGKSLLGGRVGAHDFYIRKPGESLTYTVLSVRTGMVLWLRDQIYGDIMGWCRGALPHSYDPLDRTTYEDFIRTFAECTWKHTEGNEAGDAGLALAAEAFRKSGDLLRAGFAEWLLDDSLRHMMAKMQAPSGGTIMMTNELANAGIGRGGGGDLKFGSYDSNQIGEWMRALTYGIIHYGRIPERRAWAMELNAACRRAADFLIAHSVQDSGGLHNVLRHLKLNEKPDGKVEQVTYHQEGRQCDVYLGRALAGLSYYAYAIQLLGQRVPDRWLEVMDNTVEWCARKMKPDGWFDWQCQDIVEGGCHTFLGNIYIGEGVFGVYLVDRQAGRQAQAQRAAKVARKAYRYVTDSCKVKGVPFKDQAAAAELWVGPYVYWLFSEYLDTVGPEQKLKDWLGWLDRLWSVDRAFRDFLDRPLDGTGYVSRASEHGMLSVAQLGYLGIKQMAEIGKPLHWGVGAQTRDGSVYRNPLGSMPPRR